MTPFDVGVLSVLFLSALVGLWRGLIREVFSLAAWVGALAAALALAPTAGVLVARVVGSGVLAYAIGFVLVLVATLIVLGLLGWMVSRLVAAVGLGALDRFLGSVFGFARGMLLVLVFVVAAGLTALPARPWWREAALAPALEAAALAARPWLPRELAQRIRYPADAVRTARRAHAGLPAGRCACAA